MIHTVKGFGIVDNRNTTLDINKINYKDLCSDIIKSELVSLINYRNASMGISYKPISNAEKLPIYIFIDRYVCVYIKIQLH